jgi:hypothetical protein
VPLFIFCQGPYILSAKYDKKSKRISRVIWSCSWTFDDNYFLTASRDKKVIIITLIFNFLLHLESI